uniref:Zinc finger CCCH domain-containing protein 14 n=1 Tax=Setaria digitata TaxID=48799 RepID=A0A915Q4B8_9BILA
MTGGTTEVSKKIRAAIKAKLEELGVYVDEELPDYIMVMIANKKEKTQMKEDLLLFLGKNSEKFVDWLFDIFERLQSASVPKDVQDSIDSKRKDNESSGHRRELESSSKKEKEKAMEKKKRQESSGSKSTLKEHDKKEKERQRGVKEPERRENEKRTGVAKVVKSKPPRRTKSPVLPPEKTHRRKRPESPECRGIRSGARRDDAERNDRKILQVKSEGRTEREAREDAKYSRKRNDEEAKRTKRDISTSKASGDLGQDVPQQRKRKALSRSPSLENDIDDEERIAAEETAHILRSKKVQSSAVVKLPPEPTVKSVSSQVVVKRKLPEKEILTKQSRGVKSLFLKAIKEAGETTRTASQIAGYGGGLAVKKEKETTDHGKHKQNDNMLDEEEGIEIDVYDDIGDALVVMPDESNGGNGNGRSIVQAVDDCSLSEPEVERKRLRTYGPNSVDEPKFYITLKGDSISGLAKRLTKIGEGNVEIVSKKVKAKRRRNETNPILAHLNLSQPRQIRREVSHEKPVTINMESETCLVEPSNEVSDGSKPLPAWDLQIQLPEEDTSDDGDDDGDDEAQIDAVLASAQTVGQGFDEVPPTPALSSPLFRPQTPPPQLFYTTPRQNIFSTSRQLSNASVVSSTGTDKIMERCKFWPNCSLQNCVYIHPSKPCSNFPNCSFGDRCIYIHPQCKFGRMCLNPSCVYVHTLRTTPTVTSAVTPSTEVAPQAALNSTAPAASYTLNVPCKYGGKCANASCSFKHPKLCRFGDRCTNRACYFWHPKASAVAVLSAASGKYRWKAPSVAAT